ncbi:MAG: RNA repair transcriptional activator RtcR [Planctomycetota bacterium]
MKAASNSPARVSTRSNWRPTVSLCQHEDLLIDRFELIYQAKFKDLMELTRADILSVSPETCVTPRLLEFQDPWDFEEVFGELHDFAHGYQFDPDAEDYLVHITTGTHVVQICLFLLTESRAFPGRLVQTEPPRRRHVESVGSHHIIDLDLSRYDRIAQRFALKEQTEISLLKSGIATQNEKFNRLIGRIERVALHSDEPVLLTGPTGAGKSLLARRIFELKKNRRRIEGAFVEVNCGTLRGDAAMSALFGHVKGAFTGAVADRPGLLRAADRGMLFLDEIGELGLDEQTMLLRALEEKCFLPLGADRESRSAFQLIAGTNRDLGIAVRQGRFREDLLARINLWTFTLPGLKERREDIPPNLDYELGQYAGKTGKHIAFNREARSIFLEFAMSPAAEWTANFRDLNGALTRMATMAEGGRITPEVVREEIGQLRDSWQAPVMEDREPGLAAVLDAARLDGIDLFDRIQLAGVLKVCRASASLSDAGRRLFASSRTRKQTANDADRLRKYLARFGLQFDRIK